MSENWYLMTTPNQMSGFENDYFTDYATDSFSELLTTFVGDDVTIYNSTMDIFNVVKGIIQSKDKKDEKQILLPLNSCSAGTYIKYKNLYWLITEFVNDNKMYQNAVMQLCTYTLKFQSQTGTILSYPCITDNRVQGTGDTDTKVMTLPAGRKIILLPHDEYTTLLRNDRRLFVDLHPTNPMPYEIDFVDSTKFNYGDKGLLEVYVTEGQLNSLTDRVDLGICDYFEPSDTPEPPDPEVPTEIVTITSDDAIDNEIVLGLPHLFSATFKNELGEDVDNVIAEYSVDNTYDGKVVLTDNGDGTCTVQVGDFDDTELCSEQFTLRCYDVTHGFESTVLLTIVGIF